MPNGYNLIINLSDLCSLNGTDGYKSPEQINFEPISNKSDMWALGCIT